MNINVNKYCMKSKTNKKNTAILYAFFPQINIPWRLCKLYLLTIFSLVHIYKMYPYSYNNHGYYSLVFLFWYIHKQSISKESIFQTISCLISSHISLSHCWFLYSSLDTPRVSLRHIFVRLYLPPSVETRFNRSA